jgi:hypothetical protein
VRGTTRDAGACQGIEASGVEPALADPDRLSTLLPYLPGVSALCWLMGTATGGPGAVAALHGPRLESLAAKLVDSHVRGLVYEAGGTVAPELLAAGASTVRSLGAAHRVPVEVVDSDPADLGTWIADMRAAVERVLG